MIRAERLAIHHDLATSLALLSDTELADLLATGVPVGTGIGGQTLHVELDGRRVFVKRIRLTDPERLPDNARSTANLFGTPTFCHYGVGNPGSPGFGAWRELAVHTMTTHWVLAGDFDGFPLTHHWRVLPDKPQPLPDELADVDRVVAYWGGGPGTREHIEGLSSASASLTLFLEYLPYTLHDWLDARIRTADADAACALVEQGLAEATDFLHERGLLHFDAHFRNILTDGHRLYFADYGLALSPRFRLTPAEHAFLDRHRDYDRAYATSFFVTWLVVALHGYDRDAREAYIRACADGARPEGIPAAAADVIARHAPVAAMMNDFSRRFEKESRQTPFPHDELRAFYDSSTVSG
ncbi:protein kinase family protein [Streptomyces griseus]|uniref:protein kinase family protein n=1 Tax=Streptomyces griseus TaxID=1911 RepID=UPI00055B0152|nr:protein kinase family protein [Streptomyces griseus]